MNKQPDRRYLPGVIETQQFTRAEIDTIFDLARSIRENPRSFSSSLIGKVLIRMFSRDEPSTRTRTSFGLAMRYLGGIVEDVDVEACSLQKGETFEDTVRGLGQYALEEHGLAIVMRHGEEGMVKRLARFAGVPMINAGDGAGQHPTQALLDMFTIIEHFGDCQGLKIVMARDLRHGRTVRSLCYLIGKHFPDNEVIFVSTKSLRMHGAIKRYLTGKHVSWRETESLTGILSEADVVYMTRIQEERFNNPKSLQRAINGSRDIIITRDTIGEMKPQSIILHPGPRREEISYQVDGDPRALQFLQARNGLFVRTALLYMILHGY